MTTHVIEANNASRSAPERPDSPTVALHPSCRTFDTRCRDCSQVPVVRSAEAAEYIEHRQQFAQLTVSLRKLVRVTGVEIRTFVEFRVTPGGSIRAYAADAPSP